VSLKNQLVLTTDEAFTEIERYKEEKKTRVKKPAKQSRKRKAPEVKSEIEDNVSDLGSDSALAPEIFDCIVMEYH
jgi:hypothetical protein